MRGLARDKVFSAAKGLLPAAALGLCLASFGAPHVAKAQFWGGWNDGGNWGELDRDGIRRSIGQQGFRVIAPMRRNGAVFVADVLDRRGQRERLIVAAADGQILQRFYLDDPRLPGRLPRAAAMPRDPNEQPADRADRADLVPPADIPNAGGGYTDPGADTPNQAPRARIYGRGDDEDLIEPTRPRPPVKVVKPKPRVVERSPDTVDPLSPVTRKPLDAVPAPRHEAVTPPERKPTAPASPVASAPSPTQETPPATTTRLHDPLAIPGGDAKPAAPSGETTARAVPGVTGAPAPAKPTTPARPGDVPTKPGDVPVAPLD